MTITEIAPVSLDSDFASLSLQMEPMESLEAPWGWGSFFAGVGVGVGIVVGFGVVALGVAVT